MHFVEAQYLHAAGMALQKVAPAVWPDCRYPWENAMVHVMAHVEGETLARRILRDAAFDAVRPKLARQCGAAMAGIHKADTSAIADFKVVDGPAQLAQFRERYLSYDQPKPVFELAFAWLKERLTAPRQVTLVHGDFRNGNIMVSPESGLAAVLDWELAHLGDPLEDLGWALDPLWSSDRAHPGGMLTREAAIAVWEKASGLKADPKALAWWSMFASFKGAAIWISSAKEFQAATNTDPVMAFSGLYCLPFHNKRLADMLLQAREAS